MARRKKVTALFVSAVLFFEIVAMEEDSKLKRIQKFLGLGKKEDKIVTRPRQVHRESSQEKPIAIDQMATLQLFSAIGENDPDQVERLFNDNVIYINFQEGKKKNTPLMAAVMNFEKQKDKKNEKADAKKAWKIICLLCDPKWSGEIDLQLLNADQKSAKSLAQECAQKYEMPQLVSAIEMIELNKNCAEIMNKNMKAMREDPDKKKIFEKLVGVREDSFYMTFLGAAKNKLMSRKDSLKTKEAQPETQVEKEELSTDGKPGLP
ncbi:MAG TPA: hypothetical protein VHO47_05770 [Candidatus Babeliales bacterium]|nr:hypothetical protein [Candidatus Babeliales bacterium]